MNMNIELQDLIDEVFNYEPTPWQDEVNDPEGDNSQEATPFAAILANKFEHGIEKAHDRLNDMVEFHEYAERIRKNLRFDFLLLRASVTSGLTSNMLVDNFETLDNIDLKNGDYDPELQRVFLP